MDRSFFAFFVAKDLRFGKILLARWIYLLLVQAQEVASREENKGKMIVTIFPSGGERYMNSDLFAAVREECMAMTF
ncbi:hypothetical protein ABZP36_010100 [Zizania latifolia]